MILIGFFVVENIAFKLFDRIIGAQISEAETAIPHPYYDIDSIPTAARMVFHTPGKQCS